jgi:hypothetical protein
LRGGLGAVTVAHPYLVPGVDAAAQRASPTRKLHNRLYTHRTRLNLQVDLNIKAPTCGAFAEPSDGLEPSTPPYHDY